MGIQKSETLLRINMSADKCENVSFKVSLLSEDSLTKTEVRRFVVPQDCSTSLIYLKEKIRTIFNLGRSTCKVSWRDEDGDDVTIESDEELLIALQELNGPVCFQKLDNLKKPPKLTTTKAKNILELLVIL